jgi:dTDP-4-amino-4,6-dideoxygalactose transaminase
MSWKSIWNVSTLLFRSNYGAYIGEGPEVKNFEKEFGEKFKDTLITQNISAVNSGTSALELAYELAGISEGDEVISPVLTFVGTNLPLVHRKAKIIFADCDVDLNIDVEDVKKKITPKTKAIVFVHFGGNNRGLRELLDLCKEKNILLIEDAAQAVGSDFWGKADFTCVSLQSIKTLTSVDGGFLITKDSELHEKGKRLRWFGYNREKKQKEGETDLIEAGYKYHMSDVTATIGRGNLASIDKIIAHRKKLIEEYKKRGFDAHMWFAVTFSDIRKELMEFLKNNGVATGIHHYRNDQYTILKDFSESRGELKNMNNLENKYILLPLHHGITVKDVEYICELIKDFNNKK